MTRIFTDGAEMQDTIFWSGFYQNVVTIGNTTPFASSYYYHYGWDMGSWKNFTAISECYARVRLRVKTHSLDHAFISFRLSSTTVAYIAEDALNRWTAKVTTVGVVGTSVGVAILNSWCLLEVYFKEANAPNGRFVLSVDGNIVIDYTGDTQPAADTTFDNVYFRSASTNDSFDIDDLALNNTSGLMDNSWCGDGIVVKITPSGSGTVNNWSNSGSVSGSANYLYVDEYPSDTTTYTYCSASSTGVKDKYAMSNLGGGIGSITRIFSEARIKKEVADSTTIKLGYLPNGGTDTMSGSVALYTTYAQAIGTSASANPVTGLAWTVADVNALEYVIEMS